MPHDIAVSIINYRTGDLTLQCVRSVLQDIGDLDVHIVVVDNLSEDGSAERIAGWIAEQPAGTPITLVRSETNSGFSGGHNQGIAAAEADFYLLLNSDAVLRPGFLQAILAAARADPEPGFFAPRIIHDDGQIQDSCFRFLSPGSELVRSAATRVVDTLFGRYSVSLGPYPDPDQIGWASFACILLRAEMIRRIGPMDEGYFLYFEDAEYCFRARRAGWRVRHVPEAVVVHFRGGSGPVKALAKQRAQLPRYYYSSRTRYLYQAHGMAGLIAANLLWYLGRGIKHSTRLLGRKVPPLPKAEARNIWTNLRRPLGPRYAPWEQQ